MIRTPFFLLLGTFFASLAPCSLAQESQPSDEDRVELRLKTWSGDEAMSHLLRFEDISMETVELQGSSLQGSAYQLWVREFREGKLVGRELLFDGTESPQFRIKEDKLSFWLLCKTQDEGLRLQICTPQFSSRRLKYELAMNKLDYVLKNFMGAKSSQTFSASKSIYLYAIIPPTIHADGNGSYCEVAQSGISPEELGTKFHLPHYFLVEMVLLSQAPGR